MLIQNRVSKYLLYAIGEIILVVIGILIALQVNEWNKERNRQKAEEAIISQLKVDLLQSRTELEEIIDFFLRRAQASAYVTRAFWQTELPDDILDYRYIPFSNRIYSPVLGTARSLINSGNLELISSAELKNRLITYVENVDYKLKDISRYEETYYRKSREILNEIGARTFWSKEEYNKRNEAYVKRRSYRSTLELDLHRRPNNVEKVPFKKDLKAYFQDERVYNVYSSLFLSHSNMYFRYSEILENTNGLLDLLDSITGTSSITIDSINSEALNLVFDSLDLKIVQKADAILSDSSKWNKADDQQCEDDINTERYSLFCALYKASIDITGEYIHRRPGVEMVKLSVNKYGQRRAVTDKIIGWNNHSDTTFEELKKVLKESLDEIKKQLLKKDAGK